MSGTSATNVLVRWSGLPDPREERRGETLEVVVTVEAWQHCLKHWTNREEPWKDEFGADTVRALREDPGALPSPDHHPVRRVLEVLENQTRLSLQHPLVLFFTARKMISGSGEKRKRSAPKAKWILVLPSGPMVIAAGNRSPLWWITCYYPEAAAVESNREKRWQATARSIIALYLPLRGDPPRLLAPKPEEKVVRKTRRGKPVEVVRNLRFITPENWGFRPDLNGCPWRGQLASWDAAKGDPAAQKSAKKRQLKPRRHEDQDPFNTAMLEET